MDPTDAGFFSMPQVSQTGPRPLLVFETRAVEIPAKSIAEGRPIHENRDVVGITNPGSKDQIWKRVPKEINDPYILQVYEYWKKTSQVPTTGTPLTEVPFLTPAQIKDLQGINITTLEALEQAPDTACQRMMGLVELRKKAATYMKSAKDSSMVMRLESELVDRDRKISMLEKQMQEVNRRFEDVMNGRVSA